MGGVQPDENLIVAVADGGCLRILVQRSHMHRHLFATEQHRAAVADGRGGRGGDLLDVLKLHNLPASKENICAAIAIIDQESSFVADPAVAGLGKISEAALRAKMDKVPVLGRVALHFLEVTPSPADNYLARIRAARTERDLDLVYRNLVEDAGKQTGLGLVINSGLINKQIDGRNEIDTIGSMQVSVDFALETAKRRRWLPMSCKYFTRVRMSGKSCG